MMIKPKGRPSSQCKHCKEMRRSKNSHSTGACTCGKKTNKIASVTKHCGCEAGKPCQCHSKRPKKIEQKDNSVNGVRQIGMDPLSDAKPVSQSTRTRVGEVSVPLDEYIPSQGGIGNVNDKLPAFFQDVPLPFEPGHGLLDLFTDTSSNLDKRDTPTVKRTASTLSSSSESFLQSSDSSTPMSISTSRASQPHHYSPMIHRPHQTLFGTFEHDLRKKDDTRDDGSMHSVEVLSVTPTFMDIPDLSDSYFTKRKAASTQNLTHLAYQNTQTNPLTKAITEYQPPLGSSVPNVSSTNTTTTDLSPTFSDNNTNSTPHPLTDDLKFDQFDVFSNFSNDAMFGLGDAVK
jgi:hypothetical protein